MSAATTLVFVLARVQPADAGAEPVADAEVRAPRGYDGPLAGDAAPADPDLVDPVVPDGPLAPRPADAATASPRPPAADVMIPSDGAMVRGSTDDLALVMPTLLAEVDARKLANTAEGYDGFAIGRFRMGMRAQPTAWLSAVGTVEFIGGEHPYLLDGFLAFRPRAWLGLTLGYAKPPLFASFRQEPVHTMPFPDRSVVVTSMFLRRDVGAEIQLRPERAPIEAIIRIGNGTASIASNDDRYPTGYAAIDLVLGRAWVGGHNRTYGLRLGASGMAESTRQRDGLSGATQWGFVFWRPTPVIGRRVVGEGHLIAYLGPVRVTAEAAVASEARARDDDGNPDTPRRTQDDTVTWGATAEVAWVVVGGRREVGRAPRVPTRGDGSWSGGAFEIAGRFDRLALGRNADDVRNGGAIGGAGVVKWWPVDFLSVAAEANVLRYDTAPVESPDRTLTWMAMVRTSVFWGYPGQSNAVGKRWLGRLAKPRRRP